MNDYEGKLSNCCGAPIVRFDLCSLCLEHTEPQDDEEFIAPDEKKHDWRENQSSGGSI
jgi:hypothetical protein